MKTVLTLTVKVEVEAAGHETEQATSDVLHETEKALDYWFEYTDRPLIARSVTIAK